ncbi:MAG: alpha/beta hydrolase [Chloroflexi bacterium]|nr:alpha/beta hydrolase [Chloroflexota bacterium]
MDQKYTDEVEPHYGQTQCPVAIFWGTEDRWIPIERGRQLHGMIKHSSFEAIPEAGHLVQEDQPEILLRALMAALPSA